MSNLIYVSLQALKLCKSNCADDLVSQVPSSLMHTCIISVLPYKQNKNTEIITIRRTTMIQVKYFHMVVKHFDFKIMK